MALIAPVQVQLNPYAELLRDSLAHNLPGTECCLVNWFSMRWFLRHWRELRIVHFHWIEYIYLGDTRLATYRKFICLVATILLAKLAHIKVVYTVHNVTPHGDKYARLNILASRVMFALADAVHVHDNQSLRAIARRHARTRNVFVIPHGNYTGVYPDECSREQARQRLKLPEGSFTYLFLGQIRPNKGIEDLIRAFRAMDDDRASLVVAGWAPQLAYGQQVKQACNGNHGVRVHAMFVPDGELQYFLKASDILVLPYRQVTTSGAALLAFSFGKPIIAPGIGCFPELVTGNRGVLYDNTEVDGLLKALRKGRELDLSKAASETLGLAASRDWQSIGKQHASMYGRICGADLSDGNRRVQP